MRFHECIETVGDIGVVSGVFGAGCCRRRTFTVCCAWWEPSEWTAGSARTQTEPGRSRRTSDRWTWRSVATRRRNVPDRNCRLPLSFSSAWGRHRRRQLPVSGRARFRRRPRFRFLFPAFEGLYGAMYLKVLFWVVSYHLSLSMIWITELWIGSLSLLTIRFRFLFPAATFGSRPAATSSATRPETGYFRSWLSGCPCRSRRLRTCVSAFRSWPDFRDAPTGIARGRSGRRWRCTSRERDPVTLSWRRC